MSTKVCKVCGIEKPLEEMMVGAISKKTGKHYRKNVCRKCFNKGREEARRVYESPARLAANKRRMDKYVTNNKEKIKDRSLRASYGINIEDYNNMLANQSGGCAICGSTTNRGNRMLAVDHCHTTHRIRGLLCSDCNTALGLLKDSSELMAKATTYLLKETQINLES